MFMAALSRALRAMFLFFRARRIKRSVCSPHNVRENTAFAHFTRPRQKHRTDLDLRARRKHSARQRGGAFFRVPGEKALCFRGTSKNQYTRLIPQILTPTENAPFWRQKLGQLDTFFPGPFLAQKRGREKTCPTALVSASTMGCFLRGFLEVPNSWGVIPARCPVRVHAET